MSVINTMLRDLDARRAGAVVGRSLLEQVAVPAHTAVPVHRTNLLLPMLACGLAAGATWWWGHVGSLNELAPRTVTNTTSPVRAPAATLVPPPVQQEVPAPKSVAAPVAFEEPGESARGAMLVLATSMSDAGIASPAPVERQVQPKAVAAKADKAAPAVRPEPMTAALPEPQALVARPVAAQPLAQVPAAATESAIHVEQSTQTAAERNQLEVQRAAELVRRGSLAEAEASLRGVLVNDKGMVAARLALASLLQRQQRLDEARVVMRDGVSFAPTQAALVLPYARMLAARADWAGAYDALLPAGDALAQDAEYRGLCGVVLQRLGRFPQSVIEYRAALKLSPAASAWWVGLGLSLEGDGRQAEARGAYLQARATNPGPELAQFVESKLVRLPGAE